MTEGFLELKERELELKLKQLELKQTLPHLYAFKHYNWSREFYDSTKKENLLCGPNQSGKSAVQIRKAIHWATDKSLWPTLWPHLKPNQFWYLYPSAKLATVEFDTKWRQFLPAGKMKDDPVYGWKENRTKDEIKYIRFNSGITLYFKSYKQDVMDLQAGTCFAIFCDEELPIDLLGELQMRLNATDGYFHMAFTATIGQDYWRKAIEPLPSEEPNHPDAAKWQVSLRHCLLYEDGTPSHWTEERIRRIEAKCPTEQDRLIRVEGKFAKPGGRKYECYDPSKNRSDKHPLPKEWLVYAAVDIGSGHSDGSDEKERAHPAAICFVAVDPTFTKGRVFKAWRGDHEKTTSGDIYVKFVEMRGSLKLAGQYYDWASADFKNIAESAGDFFEPAIKKHEIGERIINTLFKHQMLSIQRDDHELDKLSDEFSTILKDTKAHQINDLSDACRYAVTSIPWNFSFLDGLPVEQPVEKRELTEQDRRRGLSDDSHEIGLEHEFEEWNEMYSA